MQSCHDEGFVVAIDVFVVADHCNDTMTKVLLLQLMFFVGADHCNDARMKFLLLQLMFFVGAVYFTSSWWSLCVAAAAIVSLSLCWWQFSFVISPNLFDYYERLHQL